MSENSAGAESGNRTERAESAWTEVREDGVALLCWDNQRGETKSVELSPEAAAHLREDFRSGPSVRNDMEGDV